MKYETKLSTLRHLTLKLQGLDLKSVLIRAAAEKAEFIAHEVHTAEEIFHELKAGIYKYTNELPMDECYNLASDAATLEKLKKELIDNPARDFQWAETLHVLLADTEGTERKLLETVLTNQYNYIKESEGFSSGGLIDAFNKILVPITRRIFTNFEVGKLVGVQPMSAPVSISYLLRLAEDKAKVDINDKDWAKALKEDKKVPSEGKLDLAGTAGRRMTLEIVGETCEASSKRLQAGWTIEAAQDLSHHDLNIEAEMTQAVASEIQSEISTNIVGDLRNLAGEPMEINIDGNDEAAKLKLSCHINRACNDIAVKTRRGAGNWMVVPHTILSLIEDLPNYTKTSKGKYDLFGTLMEVGILNGTIKVFSALHMQQDEILVGYKGHSGACDTGYVYCPYIPVLSSGVVVHPETFQPIVSLMTRSGVSLNGNHDRDEEGNEKSDNLAFAEDYYNLIKVTGELFANKKQTDEE